MILRDLRYAWRTLSARHNRAFTLATVLSFALGIGAATAIFSIVHAVLLAPLPYAESDRVVRVFERNPSRGLPEFSVSYPNFLSWAERARSVEAIAGLNAEGVNLGAAGRFERVQGLRASAPVWDVLGMPLVAGRPFTGAEDRVGGPPVAILGEGIWRTRFDADPSLVGGAITINGVSHTVVGIAPQDVGFATDIAVWLPLTPNPEMYGRGDRRIDVIARLAPGVTPQQAQAELDSISTALATEFPDTNLGWEAVVQGARQWIVGADVRTRLLVLLAGVVLLMLVACTNVANLQIARAVARQREIGVRQALGAARRRLVAQLVAENALLAGVGGTLGLVLAAVALRIAVAVLPPSTPRLAEFALDWRAAALALGVATLTAIAFGLLPALAAMRTQLAAVLQQLGRSSVSGERGPLRQALVVVQFTLATTLVVAAALLAQHLQRLQDASLGFRADGLLVARMTLPQTGEDMDLGPHLAIYDRLLEEIRTVPGVKSAGVTSEVPLGNLNTTSMNIAAGAGDRLTYEHESVSASWRVISGGYLPTLGVPLLRGRGFAETNEHPRSMILSEGLANRLFPNGDPIGATVRLGNGQQRTVVGVAGDVRQLGLGEQPTPTMYMPTNWIVTPTMTLLVRAEDDPAALVAPIRRIAEGISPDYPLFDIRTMGNVIATSVAEPRVQTLVLVAFAGASLLLAAFGVAGVIAYLVSRRTPELAVRMALGASPRRLVGDVVRRGGLLCIAGIALGCALLQSLAKAWGGLPPDADLPAMVALGAGLLFVVGVVASWLPARHVAAISPNLALRDA